MWWKHELYTSANLDKTDSLQEDCFPSWVSRTFIYINTSRCGGIGVNSVSTWHHSWCIIPWWFLVWVTTCLSILVKKGNKHRPFQTELVLILWSVIWPKMVPSGPISPQSFGLGCLWVLSVGRQSMSWGHQCRDFWGRTAGVDIGTGVVLVKI